MDILKTVLETVTIGIDIFSALILVIGVIRCAKDIIKAMLFKSSVRDRYFTIQHAKIDLGSNVLLGLEILIVADILKTIIHPSLTDILVLGSIVVIRTVISVFLNKEIEVLDKEYEDAFEKPDPK
ncbi:DUF1622 domain-containing protein [Ruminococcaceae bacterium OttesenSCG-928-I18]|nr:DUF1622 domain-containing protein [Ruminococcaceae bacterium OttesenSCG-928-I18]